MFTDPSKVVIQLKDKSKNRNERNCSRKSTVDKMLFDKSTKNKEKKRPFKRERGLVCASLRYNRSYRRESVSYGRV